MLSQIRSYLCGYTAFLIMRLFCTQTALTPRVPISGTHPNTVMISEPGVYALVFSSNLPSTKKFQHCVFSKVLPSIRKTGQYTNYPGWWATRPWDRPPQQGCCVPEALSPQCDNSARVWIRLKNCVTHTGRVIRVVSQTFSWAISISTTVASASSSKR